VPWNEVQILRFHENCARDTPLQSVYFIFLHLVKFQWNFHFLRSYTLIVAPMGLKFCMGSGLLHAKFHPHRCNCHPCGVKNLRMALWVTEISALCAVSSAAGKSHKKENINHTNIDWHSGDGSVVNTAFFMIFAVFDPSPLTVCINCIFYIYINDHLLRNACLHLSTFSMIQQWL